MFFLDDNPHRDTLHVTYGLITLGFLIVVWTAIDPHYHMQFYDLAVGSGGRGRMWRSLVRALPPEGRVIALSLLQFVINTFTLWVFADNVEYAMGRMRYILFLAMAFAVTTFAPYFIHPEFQVHHIALNGIMAAVMGAYARIFPHEEIQIYMYHRSWRSMTSWFYIDDDAFTVTAKWVVFFFFGICLLFAYLLPYGPSTMVYVEQIAGLIFGVVAGGLFRDPDTLIMRSSDIPAEVINKDRWSHLRHFKSGKAKDPTDGIAPRAPEAPKPDKIQISDDVITF